MADRTVTVKVESTGLKEVTTQARDLNKELDKASKSRSTSSKTVRAAEAALVASGGGGGSDVGLGRGASGAGGRGGERDFARQAQGLGGLVHLYATFAANLYAVSTAFSALERAADAANMVKAADTLSARYGVALAGVSKELRRITGEALNAQDALAFANLGASAGVTSKQMSELAVVATGASKALGRDMNDAMQRIYRGAIKLEPELLDELGIMVKVDEASKTYARTLGKTAASLTDVEKRQAFVNAVIDQGTAKFQDAANIAANPYTKLIASLRDAQTVGLGLVNTVLGPIVDLLASSPIALSSAITLVIGKLAKMAMPNLLPKAEEQALKFKQVLESAQNEAIKAQKAATDAFEGTSEFKFISAENRTKAIKEVAKLGEALRDKLELDLSVKDGSVSKSALAQAKEYELKLEKEIARAQKEMEKGNLGEVAVSRRKEIVENLTKELNLVRQLQTDSSAANKLVISEELNAKAKLELNRAILAEMAAQRNLRIASLQQEGKYVAAVAEAWNSQKLITAELIKQNNLSGASAVLARTKGAAVGAFQAVKAAGIGLVSNLGTIGMVVGGVAMLGEAILAVGEKTGLLTDSFDKVNDKVSSLKDSIKALNEATNKLALSSSFAESFDYMQGQLKLVSESTTKLKEASDALRISSSTATAGDKLIDTLKGLTPFMKSATQAYAEQFAAVFKSAGAAGTINTEKYRERLVSASADQNAQSKSSSEILADLIKYQSGSKATQQILAEIFDDLNDAGKAAQTASLGMEQVTASAKELGNVTKDYVNKLLPQTELTKLQSNLLQGFAGSIANMEAAGKFAKAFTTEMAAFARLDNEAISGLVKFNAAMEDVDVKLRKNLSTVLGNSKAAEDERKKYTAAADQERKALISQYNVNTLLTNSVITVTDQVRSMTNELVNSEKKIALLNRSLRQISAVESIVGPTRGLETQRQRAESAIAAEEEKAITKQMQTIKTLLNSQLAMASNMSGLNLDKSGGIGNLEAISAQMKVIAAELPKLGGEELQRKQSELTNLAGTYRDISQLIMAQDALESKLAIAQAKRASKLERDLRMANAAGEQEKNSLEWRISTTAKELELLNVKADTLESLQSGLSVVYAAQKAELTNRNEVLQVEKELSDIAKKRTQTLAVLANANTSDAKKQAKELLASLTSQETSLQRVKEELADRSKISKLNAQMAVDEFKRNASMQKYSSLISLVSDATNSLYVTNSGLVKLYETQAAAEMEATKLRTASLDDQIAKQELIISKLDDVSAKVAAEDALQGLKNQKLAEEIKLRNTLVALAAKQREAAMKEFEQTPTQAGFAKYMQNIGDDFVYKMKEAAKAAESVGSTLNRGIISGIDSTIDQLTKAIMEGNLNIQELGRFARNQLASAFQEAAAAQLKQAWKTFMGDLLPKTEMERQTSELMSNTLELKMLNANISTLAATQQYPMSVPMEQQGVNNPLFKKASELSYRSSETSLRAADTQNTASQDLLKSSDVSLLASTTLLAFTGQWKQAAMMFLTQLATTMMSSQSGGGGGLGILGTLFKLGVGYLTGGASLASTAATYGTTIGSQQTAMLAAQDAAFFAKGGIMSEYGPVKLQKYAKGGIADSPQLALYGEGSQREAYVPLPDNRSIPVTLSGGTGGVNIGDTNINITIEGSNVQSSVEEQTALGKLLAASVKKTVQEELVKQARPGGMFYGATR